MASFNIAPIDDMAAISNVKSDGTLRIEADNDDVV